MAITYNIAEAYTGTRTTSMPDPDNEGETIEETVNVTDVEVTFTDDSYTPDKVHTRMVNVCFDSEGAYDDTAATSLTQVLVIELSMSNMLNNSRPAVNSLNWLRKPLENLLFASVNTYSTPKSALL